MEPVFYIYKYSAYAYTVYNIHSAILCVVFYITDPLLYQDKKNDNFV